MIFPTIVQVNHKALGRVLASRISRPFDTFFYRAISR
jgi:hypothetical protein